MDGPNHLITIRDAALQSRVFLGQVGANYGLQVFGPTGALMWDFTNGAQTNGIAGLAVTTPKISLNAVTETIIFVSSGGTQSTGTEVDITTMIFPQLTAGDTVWLFVTAIGVQNSGVNPVLTLFLREDSLTGTILNGTLEQNPGAATSMALQAVYTPTINLSNKGFVLSMQLSGGTGNVETQGIAWTGIRFKR